MFAAFKRLNPNIKIAYHSCGSIVPIIPDYIEIGMDFLNPMQPGAANMVLNVLYEKYKEKIGFFGGVDVQGVLPKGGTEEVRAEVRRCMDAVKKKQPLHHCPGTQHSARYAGSKCLRVFLTRQKNMGF